MKKILLTLVLALMACGMNAQTNDAWVIPGPISYDNGKLLNANGVLWAFIALGQINYYLLRLNSLPHDGI